MSTTPTKSAGDGGLKPGARAATLTNSATSSRRSKLVIHPDIFSVKVYDHKIRCEDYFSLELEKDLEKYQSKIEVLRSQAKIDQAIKVFEHKRVNFNDMEKKVEPVRLELAAAVEESNNAKAAYDSKLLAIGQIESSIITNVTGSMSVAEKLKSRKTELEISRLKAELLQCEIDALEADMLLESKKSATEALIEEFEDARTALGKEEFTLCDMKAAYKTLVAEWDAKYYDEETTLTTFSHTEPEQDLSTALTAALDDAEMKTKQLEFLQAATSQTQVQLQEKAAADAARIAILLKELETYKAAELTIREDTDAAAKQVFQLANELETSKASELVTKEKNINFQDEFNTLQKKADADAHQISTLSKQAEVAAKQITSLSIKVETFKATASTLKDLHKTITDLEHKLHWQNSAAEYAQNVLKTQIQFQDKQIKILKAATSNASNPSENIENELKKVIHAQAREIEVLKAAATNATVSPENIKAELQTKINSQAQEIKALKAAAGSTGITVNDNVVTELETKIGAQSQEVETLKTTAPLNTTGTSEDTETELKEKINNRAQELVILKKIIAANVTSTPKGIETKIETMNASKFQALLDSQVKDIEVLKQENVKVSREVSILNHQIAIMQPLYLLGRRVRVRHNVQQLRNKFGGQVSINVNTLEDGFVAVNGGRAIADSTIYIAGMYKPVEGEEYHRDHRDFEDLYSVTASAAWEHREFAIFINILDMLVDMKVYVRGNSEEKRENFQILADSILPHLYPKFEISSDEEFAKHPDLVEAYKTMCKEHKEVIYADWQQRRKHAEKSWFEPSWMITHYDFDNTAKQAGAF